jgi:lactose/L-arabinose transport system ATP-binding protein
MAALTLRGIKKNFGNTTTIHGIDLDIADGEFTVFVGPSGCGKSTLLRMIAGLEEVSEGSVAIGEHDVTWVAPGARKVAMVFQSYALYPHMTVLENLTFGMRMRGIARDVIKQKMGMAVEILRLAPYLQRKPGELSGGQCQRVAIGRALVQEPDVFLFDEPLSNLDAELRLKMRVEISALHKRLGKTMIYVTHDQVEAMTLADKIVVMRDGVIEQVGRPLDLYAKPANQFVAGFIGSPAMNFLPATLQNELGGWVVQFAEGDKLSLGECESVSLADSVMQVGIRPEHFVVAHSNAEGTLSAKIETVEKLGATAYVYAKLGSQTICVECRDVAHFTVGDTINLKVPAEAIHLFDGGGKRIN